MFACPIPFLDHGGAELSDQFLDGGLGLTRECARQHESPVHPSSTNGAELAGFGLLGFYVGVVMTSADPIT